MCSADKANFLVLFYTVDLVYVQPLGPGLHSRPGVDLIYVQLQDLVHIRSRPGLRKCVRSKFAVLTLATPPAHPVSRD